MLDAKLLANELDQEARQPIHEFWKAAHYLVKKIQQDARADGFTKGLEAALEHLESSWILTVKQAKQEIRGMLPREE